MPTSGRIVVIRPDGQDGPICDWCSVECGIGSDPSCDICISLPTVAPIHCKLELLNNGLVQATSRLDDEFKMLINGVRLKGSCVLPNACVLTTGTRQFRFFYPTAHTPTTPRVESPNKSPRVATPDAMPKVRPLHKFTPRRMPLTPKPPNSRSKLSTPRSASGTRERYGPVPSRPMATPPDVRVLRHSPSTLSPPRSTGPTTPSERRSPTQEFLIRSVQRSISATPEKTMSTKTPLSNKPVQLSAKKRLHSASPTTVARSRSTPGKTPRQAGMHTPRAMLMKQIHKTPVPRSPLVSRQSPSPNPVKYNSLIQSAVKSKGTPYSPRTQGKPVVSTAKKSPVNRSPSTPKLSDASRRKSMSKAVPATARHPNTLKRPASARPSLLLENILKSAAKRSKGVSFGPALSPEQFDRSLPPSTPVKKGALPSFIATPKSPKTPATVSKTLSSFNSSGFSPRTPATPSFLANTSRISGVISLPPTPDMNLLDSYNRSTTSPKVITTAHYSAPSMRYKTGKANSVTAPRHSFGPGSTVHKSASGTRSKLRAPPSTPASLNRSKKRYSSATSTPSSNVKNNSPANKLNNTLNAVNNRSMSHNEAPIPAMKQRRHSDGKLVSHRAPKMIVGSRKSLPVKLKRQNTPKIPIDLIRTKLVSSPNYGSASVTPHSIKKTATKNSGQRRMTKSPRSISAPRLSSVSDVEVTEHSYSASRTSSVRSSDSPYSIRKSPAITPKSTGVRYSRKNPKSVSTPTIFTQSQIDMTRSPSTARSPSAQTSVLNASRKSTAKTPKTTGKRLSVSTPRLSIMSDHSRIEGAVSEQLSSAQSSASKTPSNVRKSAAKTPRLAGIRRLMKTPKSAKTPRLSGVSDLFYIDDAEGSPVAGRSSSAHASVTPHSVRKSAVKTPRTTGNRRSIKTPRSVSTPRLSMVSDHSRTESTRSAVSKRSSSARSSVSTTPGNVSKSAVKTPRMTGVRRLMKTPKSAKTPRLSGVSDLFYIDDVERSPVTGRSSSAHASVTPRSVRKSSAKTPRMTGGRRSIKTPRLSIVSDHSHFEDVVSSVSQRSSTARTSGTPHSLQKSTAKTPKTTGNRRSIKTPRSVSTPRLSMVSDHSRTESARSTVSKRSSSAQSSVSTTPRNVRKSVVKTPKMTSVRRMMKTPKSGVSDLFYIDDTDHSLVTGRSPSAHASVTPRSVRKSSAKTPRMTGGRRSIKTPRLSIVSDHSQFEDTGSPVSQRSSTARTSGTPHSLQKSAAKTPKTTGNRRSIKTPRSVSTPRLSMVSDHSRTESARSTVSKRSSSARSFASKTPHSVSKSAVKTPRLAGIRRLMKTPKSAKTPRVSGVSDLFYIDDVERSPVTGRSSSAHASVTPRSVRKSSAKTPRMTGSRRSIKTPRLSIVSDHSQFEDAGSPVSQRSSTARTSGTPHSLQKSAAKTPKTTGNRRSIKTPRSVSTPRLSMVSDHSRTESARSTVSKRSSSAQSFVSTTPRNVRKSVVKTPKMTGVRRLMKTPKSAKTPRLSGVSDLFYINDAERSPVAGRSSFAHASVLGTPGSIHESTAKTPKSTGVRRLVNTPKSVSISRISTVTDSSRIDDRTPASKRVSSARPSASATPRGVRKPAAKTPRMTGVRRLMKTPKSAATPRLSGVSNLFNVSERSSVAGRLSSEVVSVLGSIHKSAAKTPKSTGVRRVLKAPKSVSTPRMSSVIDHSAVNVVRTPVSKKSSSARSATSATPHGARKPAAKTPRMTGVRRLMKTPKSVSTPRLSGVADLFFSDIALSKSSMQVKASSETPTVSKRAVRRVVKRGARSPIVVKSPLLQSSPSPVPNKRNRRVAVTKKETKLPTPSSVPKKRTRRGADSTTKSTATPMKQEIKSARSTNVTASKSKSTGKSPAPIKTTRRGATVKKSTTKSTEEYQPTAVASPITKSRTPVPIKTNRRGAAVKKSTTKSTEEYQPTAVRSPITKSQTPVQIKTNRRGAATKAKLVGSPLKRLTTAAKSSSRTPKSAKSPIRRTRRRALTVISPSVPKKSDETANIKTTDKKKPSVKSTRSIKPVIPPPENITISSPPPASVKKTRRVAASKTKSTGTTLSKPSPRVSKRSAPATPRRKVIATPVSSKKPKTSKIEKSTSRTTKTGAPTPRKTRATTRKRS